MGILISRQGHMVKSHVHNLHVDAYTVIGSGGNKDSRSPSCQKIIACHIEAEIHSGAFFRFTWGHLVASLVGYVNSKVRE